MSNFSNIINSVLAFVFTVFASVMVKIETMKYKIPIFFSVGLIIGLIIAWGIWPAKFENATPGHLREDYQVYYLNWAADAYVRTGNVDQVLAILGLDLQQNPWVEKPETFQAAVEMAAGQYPDRAPVLRRMAQEIEAALGISAPEESGEDGGLSLIALLGYLVIVLALVAAALFLVSRLMSSKKQAKAPTPAPAPIPGVGTMEEAPPVILEEGEEPPLKSFTTTYVLGDDFFDPSFSIEIENDFLGECGVGISETIGPGDPKKVTALEVWLFDKSDIRTVTTVLASEYAASDQDLTAKLSPKGDVIEISPNMEVTLETTALRILAHVREVEYAQGDLPPQSHYQRVSIELRAWVKSNED